MIFSSLSSNPLNKHAMHDISYVIRTCVDCSIPVSLKHVTQFDTHNIYSFECSELPHFTFMSLLSDYFDAMSIDVNKQDVIIRLTHDFNKDIPF